MVRIIKINIITFDNYHAELAIVCSVLKKNSKNAIIKSYIKESWVN